MIKQLISQIGICNIFWSSDFCNYRDAVNQIYPNEILSISNYYYFYVADASTLINPAILYKMKYFLINIIFILKSIYFIFTLLLTYLFLLILRLKSKVFTKLIISKQLSLDVATEVTSTRYNQLLAINDLFRYFSLVYFV